MHGIRTLLPLLAMGLALGRCTPVPVNAKAREQPIDATAMISDMESYIEKALTDGAFKDIVPIDNHNGTITFIVRSWKADTFWTIPVPSGTNVTLLEPAVKRSLDGHIDPLIRVNGSITFEAQAAEGNKVITLPAPPGIHLSFVHPAVKRNAHIASATPPSRASTIQLYSYNVPDVSQGPSIATPPPESPTAATSATPSANQTQSKIPVDTVLTAEPTITQPARLGPREVPTGPWWGTVDPDKIETWHRCYSYGGPGSPVGWGDKVKTA
ncbi:hypothetical protein CAC42_1560 [Sphaceloma murrayae]|uniref:Uncharacterized protein n=1 Tax=Sphaceloma murrayae TaxID=2082308 RepID=A0A2K1R343_9PEZI|nr:hypothetical protein CAC42_1560 [Sphaceloma murrayae]